MKGLNTQELGIAISSADAVSASISMAFSDKDVLAARKLVLSGFLTQLAAYGVQAAAFNTYSRRDSFRCPSSTTDQSLPHHYSTLYWVYLIFRAAASILPCEVAFRLTSGLNEIEHKNKASQSPRVKATALWRSLPATLATNYLVYGSFALLHGLSIYNILRGTNTIKQSWLTLTTEWGQSANAIIAIVAVGHVIYAIYRLFVAESRNNDAQTPGPSGQSISEAYPPTGWKTWTYWPWNAQWWPFHLELDYSDHLLVDEGVLQRILKPPVQQTPEVLKELWEDMMDGFTWNRPDVVLDCLDRGVPLERCDDAGNYPIHLAARHNNTDILMRTRSSFTRDSVGSDPLLLQNLANETPLEVACNANTLEAVRWIMERLPQTHTKAKDAVCQAFKIAISGEKEGILRVLQHLWPKWRTLEIQSQSHKFSLLLFAIKEHKAKSAYRLIDPAVISRRQPNPHRIFELGWKLDLGNYSLETILDDRQDKLSFRDYTLDLTHGVIGSSTLDNDEKLELLLALNVDISIILRQSVAFAADQNFDPDRTGNMWEYILQKGCAFEPEDLDSIITFELIVRDDGSDVVPLDPEDMENPRSIDPEYDAEKAKADKDRASLLRSRIREALIHCGGRDWSEAVKAVAKASTQDLKRLISLETDATMLQRMLNVKDRLHDSLLRHAMPKPPHKQSLECMDLILKHASRVKEPDLAYAYQRAFGWDGDITFFMLLATYARHEVTSDALRTVCDPRDSHYRTYVLYQILLRCGANPTLMDENGKTPRDVYRGMGDLITEKWSDGPDELRRYKRLEVLGKRGMGIPIGEVISEVMSLLQRWEDYHNDPKIGKPSDRPDPDWEALRGYIDDESKWAILVEKNPEGFKIVEGT